MTTITKEFQKIVRNNLLVHSDQIISELTDETEINRWKLYRQQLRDFFVDKPADFNYEQLTWPRTPTDIDDLKEKAAAGDEIAIQIIQRDNL